MSMMLIRELSDGLRHGSSLSVFGLLKMSIFSAWTRIEMFVSSSSVISSSMIDCSKNWGFGVSQGGETARLAIFFGFNLGEKSFSIFDNLDGDSTGVGSTVGTTLADGDVGLTSGSLVVDLALVMKDLATSIFFRGNLGEIFDSFEPILAPNLIFFSGVDGSVGFGVGSDDDDAGLGDGSEGTSTGCFCFVSTVLGDSGKLFAETGLDFSSTPFGSIELELVRCGGVGGFVSNFSSLVALDFVFTGIGGGCAVFCSTADWMIWTTFFVDSFGSTGNCGFFATIELGAE
jgi:hypothetical protein